MYPHIIQVLRRRRTRTRWLPHGRGLFLDDGDWAGFGEDDDDDDASLSPEAYLDDDLGAVLDAISFRMLRGNTENSGMQQETDNIPAGFASNMTNGRSSSGDLMQETTRQGLFTRLVSSNLASALLCPYHNFTIDGSNVAIGRVLRQLFTLMTLHFVYPPWKIGTVNSTERCICISLDQSFLRKSLFPPHSLNWERLCLNSSQLSRSCGLIPTLYAYPHLPLICRPFPPLVSAHRLRVPHASAPLYSIIITQLWV